MKLQYKFLVSAHIVKNGDFQRNPANKSSGKLITLQEFLKLAKTKAVPGVLVNIQVSNITNFGFLTKIYTSY